MARCARVRRVVGAGVYYGAATVEASACRDQEVYILGGGDSAGQAALFLARFARQVHIVTLGDGPRNRCRDTSSSGSSRPATWRSTPHHRHGRGRHRARGMDPHPRYQGERDQARAGRCAFRLHRCGPPVGLAGRDGRPRRQGLPPVWAGLPHRRPRGLATRPSALSARDARPGVFVAGDVRKGSVKRLTVAAGEGAAAVDLVHRYLEATFDRPAREDREAASAPMTAAASASGGPS